MDFAETAARLAGMCGAVLGWRPDEFWAATPAELGSVLSALAPRAEAAPDAATLSTLMEQFPDA